MSPTSAQSRLQTGAQWCAIGLGFSLPVSTALDNALLGTFVILWLLSGNLTGRLTLIRSHPVALTACVLAALMVLGTVWSDASSAELRNALVDALTMTLFGVFGLVFRDASTRDRAQFAFLSASTLVLAVSFLASSGMLDTFPQLAAHADPGLFKPRVTHNILMAVAAVLFAVHAMEARNRRARFLLHFLAGAAIIDVYLVVPDPAGQLGLAVAVIYLVFAQHGPRAAAAAALAFAVLAGAAWMVRGSASHETLAARFELYRNSLELVGEHPVIGVGTGSFRTAYEAKVRGTQTAVADHPHNAFLHVAAELGILGLAALIALLIAQWRSAGMLSDLIDRAAARSFLLVMVAAALISISFSEHTEGLLFVWASGLLLAEPRRPEPAGTWQP